jgi:hypothetical protein
MPFEYIVMDLSVGVTRLDSHSIMQRSGPSPIVNVDEMYFGQIS